ncbi:MAG: DUF4435 domain-containing protein [Candidatus Methanoplasma sp.]|jgi:hypothetical protein|nr:DUF4435 domain-containing protein [Candidatus Methanoplasma sp.]
MIENLTAEDIANSISMLRSSHSGPMIVVEGVTDCRLYGKFVDRNEVLIVPAHSRDNVRRSVASVWGRGDRKVIGIVDADLDILFRRSAKPPLFSTDKRDLESMILSSGAFEDILSEYADGERRLSFEERYGNIRDAVADAGLILGLMMFVSIRDGMGLCFRDIDYSLFIDRKSLEADIRRMADEVFAGSVSVRVGKKDVINAVRAEKGRLGDPWTAIRGHDAVAILNMGLLSAFGAYNSKGLDEGRLAGALRLAFGMDYFEETRLYADILEWGRKNGMDFWITR